MKDQLPREGPAGINSTGRQPFIDALVAQTFAVPGQTTGNGGEHHVSSYPITVRTTSDSITLSLNDLSYVRHRQPQTDGFVFLGRKTFTVRRVQSSSSFQQQFYLSEIILEVRSYTQVPGGLPNWAQLQNPFVEK
eukprot:TRINITY_DN9633_c0_g1_i2.p1 TRINITY_DN9633_c0_g1~~TRINITY_DN9633_c0_g1_i2.p1  ORF type:complete len:135 (+),score=17.05 TRINITY_DN9633_c0_g1_i2:121-525(+)